MRKGNKCDKCKLKEILKKAIEDARKSQECSMAQTKRANETIAKYTRKIDELDDQIKNQKV